MNDILWSRVVQIDFILNVEVGTPVTDLGRPFEGSKLNHWVIVGVVNGDQLLILRQPFRRDHRYAMEGPVRNGGAGLGGQALFDEGVYAFWFGVCFDTGRWRPSHMVNYYQFCEDEALT